MNNPKNPKLGHNKKTFLNKPVEKVALSEYGPMFPFLSQVLIFQKYCFAALSFDPLK